MDRKIWWGNVLPIMMGMTAFIVVVMVMMHETTERESVRAAYETRNGCQMDYVMVQGLCLRGYDPKLKYLKP
jgi:hypothetical protein